MAVVAKRKRERRRRKVGRKFGFFIGSGEFGVTSGSITIVYCRMVELGLYLVWKKNKSRQ